MHKDFSKDSWRDFYHCIQGKKVYIFGAGFQGLNIAGLLENKVYGWPVCGYIDSNPKITKCGKFPVYGISKLKEDPDDTVVLISTDYPGKIAVILEQIGIKNYYSYFWLTYGMRNIRKQDLAEKHEIEKVMEILEDSRSKEILKAIIEKQRLGFMDYSDISDKGEEYFLDEFFKNNGKEVFLDGGAYNGDSIESFVSWTHNKYKAIYSFEPDLDMAGIIEANLYKYHNIHFSAKGLYDKKTVLSFAKDNKVFSSHISDRDTGVEIECISLEEEVGVIPFSFIKLDVEGAEIPALMGMKNIICKYKPKLAISIYHRESDIYEIPLLIHDLVPQYKLYIRHFGKQYFGTNLYASIK